MAVLLAAGEGRRLGGRKPLARLRGRPLAWYPVSVLHLLGVTEFVIVTRGELASELRGLVEMVAGAGSAVVVVNREPWRENGYSLLLGLREADGEAVLVSMSDHVYSPRLAARVAATAYPWALYVTGCDASPCCVDTDEATKVLAAGPVEVAHGKGLPRWTCIDTGVHLARSGPLLLEAARLTCRLNEGVLGLNSLLDTLARLGMASTSRVDGLPWLEVDTPGDLEEAESGRNRWVVDHVLEWLQG